MLPKFTSKQLSTALQLTKNILAFELKGYGTVNGFMVMTHEMMPNMILMKYMKNFSSQGQPASEFKMAQINQQGDIEFIEDKFGNAFEQAAFISVCSPLDLENQQQYIIID